MILVYPGESKVITRVFLYKKKAEGQSQRKDVMTKQKTEREKLEMLHYGFEDRGRKHSQGMPVKVGNGEEKPTPPGETHFDCKSSLDF